MAVELPSKERKARQKMSSRMLQTDISNWIQKHSHKVVTGFQENLTMDEKQDKIFKLIKLKKNNDNGIVSPVRNMRLREDRSVSRNTATRSKLNSPLSFYGSSKDCTSTRGNYSLIINKVKQTL